MRKKELLLTLKNYIEKNTALEGEMAELKRLNEETAKKTEELLARAENAEKALAELEQKLSQCQAETVDEMAEEEQLPLQDESLPEAVEDYDPTPKENTKKHDPLKTEDGYIDVSAVESIPVNREMQYASEAIGEIVVKCATLCNDFAKHGGATCRELINLALGRTEVFKADCLTIASSNTSFSVKKECVDRIKADTEDYFESLRAQLD